MKWIIKNPAPKGSAGEMWGDYHFGKCLARELKILGQEVAIHYREDWDTDEPADVILLLRGKSPRRPLENARHLLWCISNPSTLTTEECAGYDAICLASRPHARELAAGLDRPVHALLQCTDVVAKAQAGPDRPRHGVIFVGNSRGVRRPCVGWAVEHGIELDLYGRHWREWGLENHVRAEYVANAALPDLYAHSRLSLNDHWHDMKALGYINNRIFDCLASGLPVLSDDFPALREVCGDNLLYYHDRESFLRAIEIYYFEYPSLLKKTAGCWSALQGDFNFTTRARELIAIAGQCDKRNRTAMPKGADVDSRTAALENMLPSIIAALPPQYPIQTLHIACDNQLTALLNARENLNYVCAATGAALGHVALDPHQLDMPDNRFGLLVAEHTASAAFDAQAAAEIERVLTSGGICLFCRQADPCKASATLTSAGLTVRPVKDGHAARHWGIAVKQSRD